jgi:glycosyltransferase involved in cell wall biosynthesis
MAQALFQHFPPGLLYVLGDPNMPAYQHEAGIETYRLLTGAGNVLDRAIQFSESLTVLLGERGELLRCAHYRDPWSGFAIEQHRALEDRPYKTVFEVNGLPSIELPYAHPDLGDRTLSKIRDQENLCLSHADRVVVPSQTIADCLRDRGLSSERIQVIPNGADIPEDASPPEDAPGRYLIYFGALQTWQGLDNLFRAMANLRDMDDLHLVVCASRHNRVAKAYRKLADKLSISPRIVWRFGLDQGELQQWLQHATASVAPLTDCSRNVDQGCCPLKILESMAAGVPVVASDLPAVCEIMQDWEHGRLVRPDRPNDLSRVLRGILEHEDEGRAMGARARQHIRDTLQWKHMTTQLHSLYDAMDC